MPPRTRSTEGKGFLDLPAELRQKVIYLAQVQLVYPITGDSNANISKLLPAFNTVFGIQIRPTVSYLDRTMKHDLQALRTSLAQTHKSWEATDAKHQSLLSGEERSLRFNEWLDHLREAQVGLKMAYTHFRQAVKVRVT